MTENANTPSTTNAIRLWDLFAGFSQVGLSGFGGVLPFARRLLVEERQWLTAEEFNSLLGLCQFLPGPNVVNLAVVVGRRFCGAGGAIVAPLGLLAGPVAIVLVLGALYDRYGTLPMAKDILRGIGLVGAGLLLAMSWRMGKAIKQPLRYLPFAVAAFLMIAWLRWPLPWVMLGLATLSSLLAYQSLRK